MAVAPRVSCCRRSDDATLARPVNDRDLLFSGSAHGVPWDVGWRRWQSMPVFESNSLVQWAHRYPNACGAALLLTAWMSLLAGRIMQVMDKFRFCVPLIYSGNGGYTHCVPATHSTTVSRKEQTGIWRTMAHLHIIMMADVEFSAENKRTFNKKCRLQRKRIGCRIHSLYPCLPYLPY